MHVQLSCYKTWSKGWYFKAHILPTCSLYIDKDVPEPEAELSFAWMFWSVSIWFWKER